MKAVCWIAAIAAVICGLSNRGSQPSSTPPANTVASSPMAQAAPTSGSSSPLTINIRPTFSNQVPSQTTPDTAPATETNPAASDPSATAAAVDPSDAAGVDAAGVDAAGVDAAGVDAAGVDAAGVDDVVDALLCAL